MESAPNHADQIVGRALEAGRQLARLDQEQTDRIARAVFEATFRARIDLARLAYEETGIGVFEHKVIKNAWASLLVYEDIRDRRTVGVISRDQGTGVTEIAQPKGPILGTIPVTNPTSTAIFKALICMKTRNPLIMSPHRGARKCIKETARIVAEAAVKAGAPEHAIQLFTKPTTEELGELMRHRKLALILATGTGSVVRLAQASGTPTLGVGPGNVPVYVHSSADFERAARTIVHSKTFDNGTVCASEQALVIEESERPRITPLLESRGAYFCSRDEMRALGAVCFDAERQTMSTFIVGQPAPVIAEKAGFPVPPGTRLLVAEPEGIGRDHPLSYEILAPVLALYSVDDYAAALTTCRALNEHGGIGHTVGVFTRDGRVVSDFAQMNAARILVNQPCTEGAIGGIFNTLRPSLTLSCGTGAGNFNTDNITIDHLLNIHRVARLRTNTRWLDMSREIWLDPQIGPEEIRERYGVEE